jgi:hypothetical protein
MHHERTASPDLVIGSLPKEPPFDALRPGTLRDPLQEVTPLHRKSTTIDEMST